MTSPTVADPGREPGQAVTAGTSTGARPPGVATGVRRAFLLASAERYLNVVLTFAVIATVSRLLTPEEVGLAVLGTSLLGIADSLREFGVSSYLVQQREVSRERVRTAFTVMLLASGLIAATLALSSGWIAEFYGKPGLAGFLQVIAMGFLLSPFGAPGQALLRRDMAFGALALINVAGTVASAVITIGLVLLGFSYMSIAWGGIAWAVVAGGLTFHARPNPWMFRPLLRDWRGALAFGGYNSATAVLNKLFEVIPYLALGRLLPIDAVALYNRALMICQIPDRVVLPGVASVALPALAAAVRDGRDLKAAYLRSLGYITVVQWPALILIALLAHPIVLLLLGGQWLAAVPLVRIIAIGLLAMFPAVLTYPVLVAVGAIRDTLTASLISLPVAALILVGAACLGLQAVALSLFLTAPLQVFVALCFIRRHVPFRWGELADAIRGSALVTACSAAGPVVVIVLAGFRLDLSPGAALLAAAGAAGSWILGLVLTGHPFLQEVRHAGEMSRRLALRLCRMANGLGIGKHPPAPSPDWS